MLPAPFHALNPYKSGASRLGPGRDGKREFEDFVNTSQRGGGPETGMAVPHVLSMQAVVGTAWRTFWHGRYDEAIRDSQANADAMRNDPFIMRLVEENKLAVCSLKVSVEVDNERDPWQKAMKDSLKQQWDAIPYATDLHWYMNEAEWYGRYGAQFSWTFKNMDLPALPKGGGLAGNTFLPGAAGNVNRGAIDAAAQVGMPSTGPQGSLAGLSNPGSTRERRRALCVKWHMPYEGDKIGYDYDGCPYILINTVAQTRLAAQGAPLGVLPDINAKSMEYGYTTAGGRALFLRTPSWRQRFAIHRGKILDSPFLDAEKGDQIHGIGIRSVIYWYWWLRDEFLSNVADWCARTGLGVRVWYYDSGNAQSEAAANKAAREQMDKTNILIAREPGSDAKGVEFVDTTGSGADLLLRIVQYIDEQIMLYIVGQSMSTGSDPSGGLGGTGRSDFAKSTKYQRTKLNAAKYSDTCTYDILNVMKQHSFPADLQEIPVRLVFHADAPDPKEFLESVKTFCDLGGTVIEDQARGVTGLSAPKEGDRVLGGQQPLPPGVGGGGVPTEGGEVGGKNDAPNEHNGEGPPLAPGKPAGGVGVGIFQGDGQVKPLDPMRAAAQTAGKLRMQQQHDRELQAEIERRTVAAKEEKAKYSRWITLGGHEEGDEKHVGGFHVEIDGDGKILRGGTTAMHGKPIHEAVQALHKLDADEKKERREEKPTHAAPEPAITKPAKAPAESAPAAEANGQESAPDKSANYLGGLDLEDYANEQGYRNLDSYAHGTFGYDALAKENGVDPLKVSMDRRTAADVSAMANYRAQGANIIGPKLRRGEALTPDEREQLGRVNVLAESHHMPVDSTLYRVVGDGFPDMQPGQTISDPAPMFAGFDKAAVDNIAVQGRRRTIEIQADKGAPAFYANGGEATREAVLPSNAELQVVSVNGDKIICRYKGQSQAKNQPGKPKPPASNAQQPAPAQPPVQAQTPEQPTAPPAPAPQPAEQQAEPAATKKPVRSPEEAKTLFDSMLKSRSGMPQQAEIAASQFAKRGTPEWDDYVQIGAAKLHDFTLNQPNLTASDLASQAKKIAANAIIDSQRESTAQKRGSGRVKQFGKDKSGKDLDVEAGKHVGTQGESEAPTRPDKIASRNESDQGIHKVISKLTPRDQEIAKGIMAGEEAQAIAKRLGVAPSTVSKALAKMQEAFATFKDDYAKKLLDKIRYAIAELADHARYVKDASGHEHVGAGSPEGGQFTGKGDGQSPDEMAAKLSTPQGQLPANPVDSALTQILTRERIPLLNADGLDPAWIGEELKAAGVAATPKEIDEAGRRIVAAARTAPKAAAPAKKKAAPKAAVPKPAAGGAAAAPQATAQPAQALPAAPKPQAQPAAPAASASQSKPFAGTNAGAMSLASAISYSPMGDGLSARLDEVYRKMRHDAPNLTPDQFKAFMMNAWKSGVLELKVMNEVNQMSPQQRAVVPTTNNNGEENILGYAYVKDRGKLEAMLEQAGAMSAAEEDALRTGAPIPVRPNQ